MKKIAVIGAGSWGTVLSCLLAEKGYEILLWAYEEDIVDSIKKTGINSIYLPNATIRMP
jgi:glycerol-3-phosphate dehydrogenase (NAD(P)+)